MKQYLLPLALILSLAVSTVNTADKLKMNLYVEALCPDSRWTMLMSMNSAIKGGLLDMVDLNYVVAGNASSDNYVRGSGEYNFTCQHGSVECFSNVYMNCVSHLDSNKKRALQTVICMFDYSARLANIVDQDEVLTKCLVKNYQDDALAIKKVQECAYGNMAGFDLLDDAIKATPKDHTNIPWATVEGRTLTASDQKAISSDVLSWVCDNYDIDASIAACKSTQASISIIEN